VVGQLEGKEVSRSFPVAACTQSWVIVFVIVTSSIDIVVGKVLPELCDCVFNSFVRGEQWSGTESES